MLSGVLRSNRTIEVNVAIMRAFARLREVLATNEDLARKVAQHDRQIAVLFEHVQKMLTPPPVKKSPIGFISAEGRLADPEQTSAFCSTKSYIPRSGHEIVQS